MVIPTMLRLGDFFFVLRPLILIPAWSFYLIGAHDASERYEVARIGFPSLQAFVVLTAILITAYLINQIFDQDADRINNKCFYLSRGIIAVRTVVVMAMISFVVASFAFQRVEPVNRSPLVIALLISLVYSLPPIRLCSRPVADMAANAAGYGGIAYLVGYGAYASALGDGISRCAPYVLFVAATFLHTAVLDEPGDRQSGKRTTAVWAGASASLWMAVAFHAAAALLAFSTAQTTALIVTVATLPLGVLAARRGNGSLSSAVVQGNSLAVALAAGVAWPAFLFPVAALLVISRLYYRRRFGITYPGLPRGASQTE